MSVLLSQKLRIQISPPLHHSLPLKAKKTLPITAKGLITESDELLDPLTTITSQSKSNGETQTELLVTATGAGSRKPTTSEAVTESLSCSDGINYNAIVGGLVVVVVLVTILTLLVVATSSVVVRKRKCSIRINVTCTSTEESAYDYPAGMDLDTAIEVKQNEAYATNISTADNEAYNAC